MSKNSKAFLRSCCHPDLKSLFPFVAAAYSSLLLFFSCLFLSSSLVQTRSSCCFLWPSPSVAMDSHQRQIRFHLARAIMHLNYIAGFLPLFEPDLGWESTPMSSGPSIPLAPSNFSTGSSHVHTFVPVPRPNHPPTLMTVQGTHVIWWPTQNRTCVPFILRFICRHFVMKFTPRQDHRRLLQLYLLPPEPLQHRQRQSTLPVLLLSLRHRVVCDHPSLKPFHLPLLLNQMLKQIPTMDYQWLHRHLQTWRPISTEFTALLSLTVNQPTFDLHGEPRLDWPWRQSPGGVQTGLSILPFLEVYPSKVCRTPESCRARWMFLKNTHSDLFPRDDTVPNPEDKSLVRMSTSFCTSLAACAWGSPIVNLPLFLIFWFVFSLYLIDNIFHDASFSLSWFSILWIPGQFYGIPAVARFTPVINMVLISYHDLRFMA